MALIGSRRLAREILNIVYGYTVENSEDWKYLDEGSMRDVFRHMPTGVVYKVDSTMADSGYGNYREWRNAKALRRFVWENVYIPKVSLFRLRDGIGESTVLAMEYIDGVTGTSVSTADYRRARMELYKKARFADMHGENFMFVDGVIVPVDMGSPRLRTVTSVDREGATADTRVLTAGDGRWA